MTSGLSLSNQNHVFLVKNMENHDIQESVTSAYLYH